jgi:hypothetical protein
MSHDPLVLFPIETPHHDGQTVDDMFDAWWRQYPRRVARGAAKKVATFDELMSGVMRYAAERTGEDPQFTAHGASWLNAERWLDEPKARYRKPLSMADSAALGILQAMQRGEDDGG